MTMRYSFNNADDKICGALEDIALELENRVDDILDILLDGTGELRELQREDLLEVVQKLKGLIP